VQQVPAQQLLRLLAAAALRGLLPTLWQQQQQRQ
jgi:hypothetical protein